MPLSSQAIDTLCQDPGLTQEWVSQFADDLPVMMFRACAGAHVEVVRELLGLGANPAMCQSDRGLVLTLGCVNAAGHQVEAWRVREVVDLLIGAGADPSAVDDFQERMPLLHVCSNAHLLDALLAHGADINAHTRKGANLLTEWVRVFSANPTPVALARLDEFLAAGLRRDLLIAPHPLYGANRPRQPLLVSMWQSAALRALIPDALARGFNPQQPGEDGKSFFQEVGPHLVREKPTPVIKAILDALVDHPDGAEELSKLRLEQSNSPPRRRAKRLRA